MRRRYRQVQDERGRWKLVPVGLAPPRPAPSGPMIMRDITPYESMITGEQIGSRSRHREHLRAHGFEEVGSETPSWIRERRERRKEGEPVVEKNPRPGRGGRPWPEEPARGGWEDPDLGRLA